MSGYGLRVMGYGLWVMGYGLRVMGYGLWVFAVNKIYLDGIALFKMQGKGIGAIDATVLSTRATEGDLEVFEIAFDKALDMVIDEAIDRIQEGQYFSILLKKVDDGLVMTGEVFELFILAGVMGTAAVEDIASTVAGSIGRETFLEGETNDCDGEHGYHQIGRRYTGTPVGGRDSPRRVGRYCLRR